MILGNEYIYFSAGESKQEKEITKFLDLKLLIISLTIQLEQSYILFSITFFNKFTTNLTLAIENN
jgi:CTP:phosphocholine cytidylyltransferase-like protein